MNGQKLFRILRTEIQSFKSISLAIIFADSSSVPRLISAAIAFWAMFSSTSSGIIFGDSDVLLQKMLDDGVKVNLVLTDPPYNLKDVRKRTGWKE